MTQTYSDRITPVADAAEHRHSPGSGDGINAANREIREGLNTFAEIQRQMRGPDTSGLHDFQITAAARPLPADNARGGPDAGLEPANISHRAERPVADRNPFIRFDHRASAEFRDQLQATSQSVREQMPEGVRELLAKVQLQPVRSINNDPSLGGLYEPSRDPHKIIVTERGTQGGLESVVKHEFGHAFDHLSSKRPLSDDPQFRRLVDQGITPGSALARERRNNREAFYAEVFGDLFARNLNAPAKDLSVRGAEKLTAAQEWVRAKMHNR
ncbi:MAG: hypothetical protein K2Y39_28810 [Candidatus Obscuribacterales bacterium]|nr:hypothetical protein [Candidatus Obscuribacterales bacterium]